MIRPWSLIWVLMYSEIYLWVDVILIKETRKAILIEFDGRKKWLPKAWVVRIKSSKSRHYRKLCQRQSDRALPNSN